MNDRKAITSTALRPVAPALLLAWALFSSGCSSLPPLSPSVPTAAVAVDAQSPLAVMTQAVLPPDDRSGFRLQPYGPNAFATRIELARLATRSLDVQYYILQGDNTGRTLMRALRDAAARGVRVRLLVDDLYTAGEDDLLLALASYPNVEVRLFNPFPGGRASQLTRFIRSGLDFGRVNRRMHNKLFVADNVAAVAGGRNMADEYVMNAKGSNYIDMDVFAAGPVVRDLSDEFDHYWNSDVVYPVQRIASSARTTAELQQSFEQLTAIATQPEVARAPADGKFGPSTDGSPDAVPLPLVPMLNLPFELADRRLGPLLPARARVLYDPLSKARGLNEQEDSIKGTVTEGMLNWMRTARQSIKMISPYFVPTEAGVDGLVFARRQGLTVELVTNSLASTDEPWVYVGYRAHIDRMLAAGVKIWEISPSLSVTRRKLGVFGKRTGALHMKSAIVDHAQVFLGSMNLDRRSAKLNTELGLIIESPVMARQIEGFSDGGSSYQLRLNAESRSVEWFVDNDDGTETVFDVPPETTAWQRFRLRLVGPFIPEGEL